MNTATFVRKIEGWNGDASLYKLSPPMESSDGDGEKLTNDYVIVSAVVAPYTGPETYIFPATEEGEPKNYSELTGSYRGGMSHAEALEGAGYTISEPQTA